jgi:neuromedin U receptor 1
MAYFERLVLLINETKTDGVDQLMTSTEVDADTFLAEKLGPRYKGMAEAYVLTLMYCAIFVTGVIGNVCTCVVIVRNVDMHTATNCYLFSLAVSDTLTLIFGKLF